jgi:tetratricopeptide (TPR) repeat protein
MIHSINNNAKSRASAKSGLLKTLSAAGAVTLAAAYLLLSPNVSSAAEAKKQEISRTIAKEMTAAQKALQAQQWQEALKNLEAAEQKSGLTPFDKKTIYNFKGFADIKLNKLKDAQGEFEKALATGDATPEEVASMTRTLFGIAASTGQYQKTIDYGKTLVDNGTATNDNLAIIAQSYYLLKDCKDSGIWADKAIAAARKAGETPKENLYLFKLQCASDSGDTPAMDAVLMDLIKLNNKTTYWNTLLRIERQDERDDHNTLMIYRIMYNTNSMTADTDYIEMAQLLGDAALPGEAAAVLDKAMASGVVKDEHKERTNRLLTALKTRADADKKSLPQEEAEANKSAAGELLVKLGEVYYGFGEYQKAADAINQGLQKNQIKHLDEAYVYLGLSNVQLKNTADAKKAFAKLKDVPNISPRVLKLWELYAATLGMSGG